MFGKFVKVSSCILLAWHLEQIRMCSMKILMLLLLQGDWFPLTTMKGIKDAVDINLMQTLE